MQFDEAVASHVMGQSFVAAWSVMVPSSPDIPLVLGVTAAAALGVGIWLLPWPGKPAPVHQLVRRSDSDIRHVDRPGQPGTATLSGPQG